MNTHERFKRMYEHKEADRIPVIDSPWGATIERWRREGMPEGVDYVDYFGLDRTVGIWLDNSPRYEEKVLEETPEYKIYTSGWGVTMKQWKHAASTPEFLEFKVTTPEAWAEAKARMTPTRDRVDWEGLKRNYPLWKKNNAWITASFWFGFDVTHSWMVGTETLLVAMLEEPEWVSDMFNHYLDMDIALFEMVLNEGYTFDAISWPDDMGFKHSQFFSLETYRELLKPVHKRAVDWAHSKGAYAHLHSCGDINPLVPELIEIGIDALNPLEVKAGMNPVTLKQKYGRDLVLHGGINAVLWDKPDQIRAEMESTIPAMKAGGGYIFSSDHSVPSSVSVNDFRGIVELAKRLGSYA